MKPERDEKRRAEGRMDIGLITYHSAYNFGSVLQAFSTQKTLEEHGYNVAIINYRPKSQKQFYAIVKTHEGIRSFIKCVLRLTNIRGLVKRQERFEEFIRDYLKTTKEFAEPGEAYAYSDTYDVYISGSDQIWNKNSNELINSDWVYMDPYLLRFTDRKKLSYGSSLNNMSDEDALHIVDSVKKFQFLSCREETACRRIEELTGKKAVNVVDPTLLMTGEAWRKLIPDRRLIKGDYVLYYSLKGFADVKEELPLLLKKYDRVAVIAPLALMRRSRGVLNMDSAGPMEFLSLIRDAKMIVTTSYHGTLFSINMHKPFFTVRSKNPKANTRYEDILGKLGLLDRLIDSTEEVYEAPIDFDEVDVRLEKYRKQSLDYLWMALEE